MAVPEGSKPAEAVLGDCCRAQGAISSMLSGGNGPCNESASKCPLNLCQKDLAGSLSKKAWEPRDA